MTIENFSIIKNNNANYYNNEGVFITKSGGKKNRIDFNINSGEQFNIAVKIIDSSRSFHSIKSFIESYFFIKLTVGDGKELLGNINSISKRLHLDKKEIKKLCRNDNLSINKLYNQSLKLKDALFFYNEITQNPHFSTDIKIKNKTLLKAIKILFENEAKEALKIINKKKSISDDLALTIIDNEFAVTNNLIGEGGCANVNEFQLLTDKKAKKTATEVFKHAKKFKKSNDDTGKIVVEDLKKEFKSLIFLNKKGKVIGIQAAPRKMVKITVLSKNKKKITQRDGFISLKYDGDYSSNTGSSIDEQLLEFHQLFNGLKYLSKNNIVHRDLKLENVLVRTDEKGFKHVDISDFGGAIDLNSAKSDNILWSPHYTNQNDIIKLRSLIKFKNKNNKDIISHDKKRDVFAMGVLLYKVLNGPSSNPYDMTITFSSLDTSSSYKPINNPNAPEDLKNLVEKMLNPIAADRPSAEEAFNELNTLIKTKYPHVYKKLKENKMI